MPRLKCRWLPAALLLLCLCESAAAALDIGDAAPRFTAQAAFDGKVFRYSLADALAKGPVVLYFFPAAFSVDCSIEAHAFAASMDKFTALGATVIGVSGDDIGTLSKFSQQACQSRFPVASDASQSIMKSFDATMQTRPDYANRISYLITPDDKVASFYLSLSPEWHVKRMLDALGQLPGLPGTTKP